ncbi:uncharacterized protein LOC143347603 isoform X4 [Colletes latitarsis]|uniref:uncharacterized protein LOC143347603 isoform X4 n=1 Tax=Colletes latitarsis TaxID=2605962 RepID=UPI0040364D06
MEATKEVDGEDPSRTNVQAGKKEVPERLRVLSVDKLTVEKIVLESSTGSREVLLTKNESSRKLSIKSEPGKTIPTQSKDEQRESTDVKYRASLSEDAFVYVPSNDVSVNEVVSKTSGANDVPAPNVERRIKPIKLTKSPSIGSIVVAGLKSACKIPPKVPEKPAAASLAISLRNGRESSDTNVSRSANKLIGIIEEGQDEKSSASESVGDGRKIEKEKEQNEKDEIVNEDQQKLEGNGVEIDAKDRLEKSRSKIGVLQQNLGTQIDANTAENYKRKLLELRTCYALKLPVVVDSNANEKFVGEVAFDKEFLRKHNLDKRLKIEENSALETDPDRVSNGERIDEESNERIVTERSARPSYSKKVSEVEKRWSGEFLENRLERHSSGSSKSSYVEEFDSVSSRESVGEEHRSDALFIEQGTRQVDLEEGSGLSIDVSGRQTSEEVLADSTDVSTVDSDSCLEDRIKAVEEDIDEAANKTRLPSDDGADRRQEEFERANRWIESIIPTNDRFQERRDESQRVLSFYPDAGLGSTDSIDSTFVDRSRSGRDGYAKLIREFTMETTSVAAGSSRAKKEKKKLGLRRLLPGFFSPKDSRKDYKKKESKERKRQDDRHFARYQQNGNYTRSPDTMNLNEDIKRNVKLDNSLNGSIIEERLDEIKRELFPDQGPITSTPDHFTRDDDQSLLRDRAGPPRSYTTDSSLSSIAPDERWIERNNAHLGISPDIRKFEQRQKREEFGQRYGQLERKHSLQEPNHATRSYFFHRNHGPSGRISAPPSERYFVRPRAIHPIDRPLPAIPHSRTELSNYENYLEEQEEMPTQTTRYGKSPYAYSFAPDKSNYSNEPGLYENDNASGLILKSVSAQVKITRQPIVNQNHRAPLVGRSPKYPSSGSSQKSGDYADSSCTPNSSQKSEFSPSSSKSGEYYLHSPRNSGSPTGRDLDEDCRREGIYENEKSPSRSSTRCMDERIYDENPPSGCEDRSSTPTNSKQLDRSMEGSLEKRDTPSNRSPTKSLQIAEKPDDDQRHEQSTSQAVGSSPAGSPSQGKTVSSPTARAPPPSRRAQPNEQILIASPKRETPYETRIPRPSNESRRYAVESPVHITNSPRRLQAGNSLEPRSQDHAENPREDQSFRGSRMANFAGQGSTANLTAELPRPEPIYGHRGQPIPSQRSSYRSNVQKKDCEDRVAWVQGRASSPAKNSQKRVESERSSPRTEKCSRSLELRSTEGQRRENHAVQSQHPASPHVELQRPRIPSQEKTQQSSNAGPPPQQQQQLLQLRSLEEPVYLQRVSEPVYGQRGTSGGALSPSKQETRQQLEAFYWQQKALEARRKSFATPVTASPRQAGRKIDLPEVREAVYWQQLKKLDEEQQRRIYEQNLAEERSRGRSKSPGRPTTSRQGTPRGPVTTDLSISTAYADPSAWTDDRRRTKGNPTGKPPLMQKGQNQPVLIVRPQQAIRDRREAPSKPLDPTRLEMQRSKSASPHFHRGDTQSIPRKVDTRSIYEEDVNDADGKTAPPPIFKRGSLIGGDPAEYGTAGGAKRVSFSNQSALGPDLASGSWPTKHGTAPEPPTRRHRSEDSASDSDSVFSHQDRRDVGHCLDAAEYDADRPLPPLPKDSPGNATRPGAARNNVYGDLGWNSGPDPRRTSPNAIADQMQRVLRQKEEEWNPDGKGRQSNDTGGSGRGEGEPGSNEIPIGRRGGGGGGGGGVGGGSVLGVGGGGGSGSIGGGSVSRSGSGGGGRSRDEPRRHTLGGDHQPSLHHQQFNAAQQLHPLHPHHPHHLPPPHGQYGTPPTRHTTMDLEMGTKSRQRKSPLPRGFPPPSSTMLFDDDPGIMSEVETSSTGFRRGGKQRSSLPVVRTPSKTLERSLGLVFLQYRNETKRTLLPNEITSIDTVKALFVRSFPKQLTMEYLDSPHVKVYIHDSNKNMFYELEDLRSHLKDIRDRSVLRLFESTDGVTGMPGPLEIPGNAPLGLPPHWEDQSYFSEPEFDSEYQHQHIHKSKTAKNSTSGSSGYYVGGSSTLPRGGQLMRAYSPAASSVVGGPTATPTQPKPLATPDGWIGGGGVPPAKPLRSYQCSKSPLGSLGGSARFSRDSSVSLYSIADRLHGESGYMSSPERSGGVGSGTGRYPPGPYSAGSSYEDPYYSQYSGTVTPVIDEEASGWCSDTELLEESYSLYGVKPGRPPSGPPRSPFPPGAPPLPPGGQSYDATRIRVEHMERQLANLTGLVQKALTHAPHTSPSPRDYLQVPATRDPYARGPGAGDEFDKHSSSSSASLPDDSYLRTDVKPPKLGKDKSVSFEKSVSFSDEPPDMNSPKQHSPQHTADTKPTKPAIKSSTLPRMSSQERDRHKPTPPPKPAALVAGQYVYRDLALTPEMYNQLRCLQKKAKDLRQEVRNLRRMSQAQAHTVRETIRDTFITIRAMLLSGGDAAWTGGDAEKIRLSREEDLYKQEMLRLEKDLTELESTVEELRGNVINRKTRVNMSDVESMALILSKSSKTVADLKVRFPSLQEGMKGLLSSEMEKVVREEKFLKEEPERLESALRRCKKLTGTLVTLKRLASVQEQRLPNATSVDADETPPITPTSAQHSKAAASVPAERTVVGSASIIGGGSHPHEPPATHQQRPENALDALLDELQTFSRPSSQLGHVPGSSTILSDLGRSGSREAGVVPPATGTSGRAPCISDIGRKGSVDSSSGILSGAAVAVGAQNAGGTLRRLHSYPSSSDTDTSPPIARLQVSLQEQPSLPVLPQGFVPGQKPPVPERNAELLQLASARRVPPPPPPRTSSRSPLASPTSPQLPPRNHSCNLQSGNSTLRRPPARSNMPVKEGKPPMALPVDATNAVVPALEQSTVTTVLHNSSSSQSSIILSASNSSSCESVNSQEGLQSKKGRQEQLEQRHQELLRKQKALQEQYARLQQLQRNTAGLTTVPPAPPDLLKKTGSESNLLAKMGLGLSAASSGSLTSLTAKLAASHETSVDGHQPRQEEPNDHQQQIETTTGKIVVNSTSSAVTTAQTVNQTPSSESNGQPSSIVNAGCPSSTTVSTVAPIANATTTTTSKIYETDIL